MSTQMFKISLNAPLIISQSSATNGEHRCLPYIPAQTLRGLLAARCYGQLGEQDSNQRLYHSDLLFSHATLLDRNEWALPMPLSLHKAKNSLQLDGPNVQLPKETVFDPSLLTPDTQPQQLRDGFVTGSGRWLMPQLSRHTKTAIDPDTQQAAGGQLFSYQALAAGQCFAFLVSAPADQLAQYRELLTGPARLGRSRSAEFGAVDIQPMASAALPACSDQVPDLRSVWLLGDLRLTNEMGQPCFQPSADALGLPTAQWHAKASFLRSKTSSSFNSFLGGHINDTAVIQAGSVLRFKTLSLDSGLQWLNECPVLVDPLLLQTARPVFQSALIPESPTQASTAQNYSSALLQILKKRAANHDTQNQGKALGDRIYSGYALLIRQCLGYQTDSDSLPGNSQFGLLRTLAMEEHSAASVIERFKQLIRPADHDKQPLRSGWQRETQPGHQLGNAFILLLEKISDEPGADGDQSFCAALQHFAVQALATQWATIPDDDLPREIRT
jgi:CRISPR-associated protein Csx10